VLCGRRGRSRTACLSACVACGLKQAVLAATSTTNTDLLILMLTTNTDVLILMLILLLMLIPLLNTWKYRVQHAVPAAAYSYLLLPLLLIPMLILMLILMLIPIPILIPVL
jgi:hypothetical protein